MYALLDYETNMFEGTALQNISFNSKSEICTYLDQLISLSEKNLKIVGINFKDKKQNANILQSATSSQNNCGLRSAAPN